MTNMTRKENIISSPSLFSHVREMFFSCQMDATSSQSRCYSFRSLSSISDINDILDFLSSSDADRGKGIDIVKQSLFDPRKRKTINVPKEIQIIY
jgi:hypothetical protein